ncbi:MAG: PQQ-dependent sugar dehydrogenase [Chitinophagaceae bacterium]
MDCRGVILDPAYDKNHWVYIYYSPAGDDPKNILVRYEWYGKKLVETSRKLMMEVKVQREECCHVGGGMLFDKNNNLLLTTGDNTFQGHRMVLHLLTNVPENHHVMHKNHQEIQTISGERSFAYILRPTAVIVFPKEIYFPKALRKHVRKFIPWETAIHGD